MCKLVLKFVNNPKVFTTIHMSQREAYKQLYSLSSLYKMRSISISKKLIVCLAEKEKDDLQ